MAARRKRSRHLRSEEAAGAAAVVHDFGPERAHTLVRIEGYVQRGALFERAAAGTSPVVGRGPQQQLRPSHERNYQVMAGHDIDAGLPQPMVPVKEDRHDIRVEQQSIHPPALSPFTGHLAVFTPKPEIWETLAIFASFVVNAGQAEVL